MEIHKAKLSNAKEISNMMLNNINRLSLNNYSKEQVSAMRKYVQESNIKDYIHKFEVFIALEQNKIVGTISLEKDLIFSVYAKGSKNFINAKIGDKMLKFIENYAKSKKIFIISMPTTRKFFEKRGYRISEKLLLKFDNVDFPEFKLYKNICK